MGTLSAAVVIRRLVLITLLILPQRFWLGRGWRLMARVRRPWLRRTGQALLVTAAIAIVIVLCDRIFRKLLPGWASLWIAPPVQLWVFTSMFAFFWVKAIDGIRGCWSKLKTSRATAAAEHDPSRRSLLRCAVPLAGSLPFVAAAYGYARERLRFEIVRVDVPIAGLPANLNGLRIVQLSDIHIGDFMPPEEVRRAVAMANGLEPHLAVITGDFVTSYGDPLEACIAELGLLRAPLGVWGCNGNHEIYAGAEDSAEALFRYRGMMLLRQVAAQLDWNGGSFNLIGVDYERDVPLTGSILPALPGVESLVRSDMPNILLSHNPNAFSRAAGLGVGLTLAGHTHGGQINVGIGGRSWTPARFATPYIAGLFQLPMRQEAGPAYLYVNRGLGTLGIPARLGARPEITLLTLRPDAE